MRLLLASLAAVIAVAFAAPAFAQELPATPPTPVAKPKPRTAAYCNTLKTATSRNACLKRVHARAIPKTSPAKTKPKKLEAAATKSEGNPTAPAAPTPSTPTTVAVPPLPQKTI